MVGEGASFLRWRIRYFLHEEAPIPDENGMCCLFGCGLATMVVQFVVVLGDLVVEVIGGGW